MPGNIYWECVRPNIPRLIGLIDRNPASKTYGCCDRMYWHYKTVDFPSVRYQEAALTLALLYSKNLPENPYYRNHQVLEWCLSVVSYWAGMQERDGSFSEWYPHESSFVATAYSVYAVSEALLVLKASIPEMISAALEKAAKWLMRTTESRVTNQEAAGALALYNVYMLTQKDQYKIAAEGKVRALLASQNKEGWWTEYNGADMGYLSLMASYLAKYYEKTRDESIPKALDKAFSFLSYMLQPDLSAGGVYGSRNTAFFLPYGAELLAKKQPSAAIVAAHLRQALSSQQTISPITLDDRYLACRAYEWLQSEIVAEKITAKSPPYKAIFTKNFSDARIFIKSTLSYYLIINYGKGGAFLISFHKGKTFSDGGSLLFYNGRHYGAGYVSDKHDAAFMESSIKISGPLFPISMPVLSTPKLFLFRIAQSILGRVGLGLYVKKLLRNMLISGTKASKLWYHREFTLGENQVIVTDRVDAKGLYRLYAGIPLNFIYVPASNFYEKDQLYSTQSVTSSGDVTKTYSEES
jgi:hypothetical protein